MWLFGTHCHESIIFLQYCGLYMCSIFGWQVKRFWRGNCLLDKQMSVFTFVHAFVCLVLCAVPYACRCIRLLNDLICILLAVMPYTPQMWHFVGRKVYSADSFQRLPIRGNLFMFWCTDHVNRALRCENCLQTVPSAIRQAQKFSLHCRSMRLYFFIQQRFSATFSCTFRDVTLVLILLTRQTCR